ncbi:MAG: hypothetical protein FWC01_01055 [Treponema sp.]|nr:hypothetical protein [Treponema sp.]MCL2236800.1 hypothetical protein [Treponema sp.]
MINKFFNKSISIFLTMVFIIGMFPSAVFAQEELKGINRSVFDSHFSRADREIDPERWLAEAKMGLSQAISAWELIADSIYDNPSELGAARNNLESWGNAELEKRFSNWLSNRFFGKAAEKALLGYSQKDDSQKNNVALLLYSELISYVPAELRASMSDIIYETASQKSNAIKMEFENIAARDERILTSRNIKDFLNLRSQKEIEEARLFTEKLISEAESACSTGIDEIKTKIEQAAAGTGDLALMGEEWLNLYKEQFERGLKAWEEAEERFFSKRIEWEQESVTLFSEGHDVWMSAFNQLAEEQRKWELQAKELLEAGNEVFYGISEELTKNINAARNEFAQNMSIRIAEGVSIVNTWIDIYLTSISAALFAEKNREFVDEDMYLTCMANAQDAIEKIFANYSDFLGSAELTAILSPNASSEDFFLDEYQLALIRAGSNVTYWERKTSIAQAVNDFSIEYYAGRTTEEKTNSSLEYAKQSYADSLILYENEMEKLNNLGMSFQNYQIILYNLASIINNSSVLVDENTRIAYFEAVEEFANLGSLYDAQYSVVKSAYEETDKKRFEYEKQDAIKRWASTNHLNVDSFNLEDCRDKLKKSQTVLQVLGDLYNTETNRSRNDPEYDALFSVYQQKFDIKIRIHEAINEVLTDDQREFVNNQQTYFFYLEEIKKLGSIDTYYDDYVSPAGISDWTIKDVITIDNSGRIVFLRDDMTLSALNKSQANILVDYFNSTNILAGEFQNTTMYQDAIRGLSERMSDYFADEENFYTWGLARNHLILSLINSNKDLGFLKNYYVGIGELENDKSEVSKIQVMNDPFSGKPDLYSQFENRSIISEASVAYKDAWDGLSDEEKADLEFYTILTLSGNSYSNGFSHVYSLDVYNNAYDYISGKYHEAKNITDQWYLYWVVALFYIEMRDINETALNRINTPRNETDSNVKAWQNGLTASLASIAAKASAYTASTERLNDLRATADDAGAEDVKVDWMVLMAELAKSEKFDSEAISDFKFYWESMQSSSNKEYYGIQEAFSALLNWANAEETSAKNSLTAYWKNLEKNQSINENNFYNAVNDYTNGNIVIGELIAAAQIAYGANSISAKNHLDKMYMFTFKNISAYMDKGINLDEQYKTIGNDLALLTEEIMENRYIAELQAREIEWEKMVLDIAEKFNEWQKTAILVLERGRIDWTAGQQRIEASYNEWIINFQNEYERVSSEWNEAYLAGLEDKERWLERASNAANQASSQAFLSLVGAEGERMSRFMDTREPLGIRGADTEANAIMTELLQSSGVASMAIALGSLNNISSAISSKARGGMGGISLLNNMLDKTAAMEIAKKTNTEIANANTRKFAFYIRSQAEETVTHLIANVAAANLNFKESMDNYFIMGHLWRRSGSNYVKDVVKGSTLFAPVITERVTIEGYKNYTLDPIVLNTNMSDDHVLSLDSKAIEGLLDSVLLEVALISGEIFGNSQNPKGKFGEHIGDAPFEIEATDTEEAVNYEGSGELGRLLSELKHWYVVDATGLAEMSMAPWDKRMWDDSGSWFEAPSLRTVGTIAGSIAAAAVSGGASLVGIAVSIGLGTASSVVFGSLDLAYGYREFDEVAFDIGRTLLTNTISAAAGGLFGGFTAGETVFSGLTSMAAELFQSPVMQIAAKTLMTGVQTGATAIASSAIAGITYSTGGDWGYNNDVFTDGLNNAWQNALVSMTGTLVTSGLTAINSGMDLSKLRGFNALNQSDIKNLNSLIGSLAGQGVNLALGNDFTLNVLNMGLLSGGEIQGGLLELHLGRDGASMNLGTGGANVSIDNLISSFRGAQVWNVNNQISNYGNTHDFDALISLRAQYGYGNTTQKNQLWDILNGKTILDTQANGDYTAKTEINGDGNRVIRLADYEKGMSDEDQFLLAVILGHEAYRDGIVTNDNYLETRTATLAHTQMALRMIAAGENITIDNNLVRDINAYLSADMTGNMNLFNAYVDGNYDSSEDFWKLTKDGRLLYDGRADLYDEEGRLIASAGTNSLSTSLGKWMGVTQNEAMAIMRRDYGMAYTDGRGWSAPTNNNYGAYALPQYQAQYEVQWKYIDQVSTVYNGSMEAAINAMYNDARNMVSTFNQNSNLAKLTLMINSYSNLMAFAQGYNSYMYGNSETGQTGAFNTQMHAQYTSAEAQNAYSEVIRDLQNRNYTDTNSLYTHYAVGGILFNVGTENARTSTFSSYSNGTAHRFGDGLSIDTAKDLNIEETQGYNSVLGMPVYTTQYETLAFIRYTEGGYGMQVRTQTSNTTNIYAHLLQEYGNQSTTLGQLFNLSNLSKSAGVYALTLLPGTMIGRVGNTGNSTGPHLHYEMWNR